MYVLLGFLYRDQDDFDGAHNLGMVRGGEDRTSETKFLSKEPGPCLVDAVFISHEAHSLLANRRFLFNSRKVI